MKQCKTCNFYKWVYVKGMCRFYRREPYFCTKHDKTVEGENGCGQWQERIVQYDLSPARFDEVERDIQFIAEYYCGKE